MPIILTGAPLSSVMSLDLPEIGNSISTDNASENDSQQDSQDLNQTVQADETIKVENALADLEHTDTGI